MGGGDVSVRHNEVRDLVFGYAKRALLRPELEKAGLLQEETVFAYLRRPADVLVEGWG